MATIRLGDEDSSSKKEEKDEIVTETVAVDEQAEEAEKVQEDLEKMEEEALELQKEQELLAEAEEEAAANAIAEDAIANYDPENPEETVLSILKSGFETSFGENMEIAYDEADTMYTISVWQDGFAAALETDAGAQALNSMSEMLTTALQTMTEQIRMVDDDANITFNFLSDEDQNDILLTIINGEMTYNAAE